MEMRRLPTPAAPAIGFLTLTAVMLGASLASKAGLLDGLALRRVIGVCVGLMTMLTGNFLPKMRPLSARDGRVATVAAAERRAGWILLIMGLALVGLFLFAPLEIVRWAIPIVVLGGVGFVELDWIWAAWISRAQAGGAGRSQAKSAVEGRVVAGWLLFGLAYVLVMASLRMIAGDSVRLREAGSWTVIAFCVAYAAFLVLKDIGRHLGAKEPTP
jgi:hypothetical protein